MVNEVQSASVPTPVVDAHHHLWRYTAEEFAWIDDRMAVLRRDFGPAELTPEMSAAKVDRAVAVQARSSVDETASLLESAAAEPRIAGMVGWLPLEDPVALEQALARFAGETRLIGVRHIVQDEPAGFLESAAFGEGVDRITRANLAYDLLVRADQLSEATCFVDRHPNTTFLLDHLAKPRIRAGELEPWRTEFMSLARRPNVACKLSGMVTEADWQHWQPDHLAPYLDMALIAFGPQRVLAGSDWPVLLVASSYPRWWSVLRAAISRLAAGEQAAILGGNAMRLYRLRTEVR